MLSSFICPIPLAFALTPQILSAKLQDIIRET